MPVKNQSSEQKVKSVKPKNETAQKSVRRKAPGTRAGTQADWRSEGSVKLAGHHGRTIRDGR
jgi:hypothetical protein